VVAIAVIALVFVLGAVLAHYYYPAGVPYYGYPWFGWWFFPFGFFIFFIFIFFIFRVVFWGWGGGWGGRRRYWNGYGDPHEILRRRYARGEITKEQFDQMNKDLEQR
jgi:putative membrane protein